VGAGMLQHAFDIDHGNLDKHSVTTNRQKSQSSGFNLVMH